MEHREIPFSEKVDNLMKEVLEDAQLKAEEIVRQADEKSKKSLEESKVLLKKDLDAILADMNKKIARERELKILEVQTQIRNEILLKEEEKLNSFMDLIKKNLIEFAKSPKYKTFLQRAFKNILTFLYPGKYLLFFNKQDLKKVTPSDLIELNQDASLQFETSQTDYIQNHGIVLKSIDQRLTIEDSLEVRFQQKQDLIRSTAARMLFKT